MKNKELELQKKEENLKAKPAKKGIRKTFATAIIDDLIGFDDDFTKEDVGILLYLMT